LVITHVDQDHILGVLAMLRDVERPEEFSDVWFNGCDQLNDNEFESFGPVDGEFLSTAIIEQDCRGTTRSAGVRSRWAAPDTVRRHGGVHDHRSGSHSAREPDPRWAQECRDNGLIPGVDAQEPVTDDEFESFGAMDVRTVNGCRRVDANPTTRRQTCPASGFCRFDSTKILFTGYGEVPRLVASLLQADTLETRPAGLSRDHGQPFTGGGDPLDRAVRQHPGRVEQPTGGEWPRRPEPARLRYRRSSPARSAPGPTSRQTR
jgi:hypothetical protein